MNTDATTPFRKKMLTLLGAMVLFSGLALAQPAKLDDVGPGWVGPDSALYGLETAWDNSMMAVGLKNGGSVAQERAAEAKAMAEKNDTEAMQKAIDQMNNIAKTATSDDTQGLDKAYSVVSAVMENAPKQAQKGLQNALDNINRARERNGETPRGPNNRPGAGDDNASMSPQEKIDKAKSLREKGRKAISRGNDLLDENANERAKQEFADAEEHFKDAIEALSGLQNSEASELRFKLQSSKSGAQNLQDSVQAYIDGNNATARQEAQNAQDDFDQASSNR